ncbi:unnamed protein product [Caenorhabditis brenneri]
MICPDWLVTFSRVFSLTISIGCAIVYLTSFIVAFRLFKKFHVFFLTFYMAMIFTRFLALSIRSSGYFLVLFRESGVPIQIDNALWLAKFAAHASVLGCIFERSYATFYATNYENSRRCYFIICTGLTYADASSDLGRKINSVCYGLFCAVTTAILIIINRWLVKKSSAAKCNLSERYQLTENIKALRLLLPFVVSISGNSIILSVGIVAFNIDTVFNLPICRLVPYYLPIFYFIIIVTTIFNLAAPLYVLFHNRKPLQNQKIGVAEIRNVLGVNIVGDGMDKEQYFQQYKTQWA